MSHAAAATRIAQLTFGTQWKLLAGIAAVLGATFLDTLSFSSQAKEAFFKLFKPKPAETTSAPPTTPPDKQQKKSKKSKKNA